MKLYIFVIFTIFLQLTLSFRLRHRRPLLNSEKSEKNFDFHIALDHELDVLKD
jgi:hypothetical protein